MISNALRSSHDPSFNTICATCNNGGQFELCEDLHETNSLAVYSIKERSDIFEMNIPSQLYEHARKRSKAGQED